MEVQKEIRGAVNMQLRPLDTNHSVRVELATCMQLAFGYQSKLDKKEGGHWHHQTEPG